MRKTNYLGKGLWLLVIAGAVGTALGALFVTGICALMGSSNVFGPFFFSEPA